MKTTFFLTCASLAVLPSLYATDVFTIPEGFQTYTLKGQTANYIALTLTPDPIYAGTVSAVSEDTVTAPTTNPLPPEVTTLSAASPFFVKFLSGAQTGRIVQITASTAATTSGTPNGGTFTIDPTDNLGVHYDSVPLAGNISMLSPTSGSNFNVVAGDTFEILPGDTFVTLFGDNTTDNPLSLTGGTSANSADTIGFSPMLGNSFQSFFFNNASSSNQWNSSLLAGANNTVIPPYAELRMYVRNSGDENVTIFGRVSQVPLLTRTISKETAYASLRCPVDQTLHQIGIGLSGNWIKGDSLATADAIGVLTLNNTRLQTNIYYEDPSGKWHTGSNPSTDVSSTTIYSSSFVELKRVNLTSGPPLFIQSALPYTVSE